MPRNGTGVFSVVNPILVGAMRSSTAVNQNYEDAGDQITNTVPLDGSAGMEGPFKAASGQPTAPGISFGSDRNSGFRRRGVNSMAWVGGGVDRFYVDANGKAWHLGALDVAGDLVVHGEFTGTKDAARIEQLTGVGLARRTGDEQWALDDGTLPLQITRNGKGTVLPVSVLGDIRVPFAATITGASLLANAAGSCVVSLWKAPFANFPPTEANSINSASPLTLSSSSVVDDTVLSGWSTAIAAGDVIRVNLNSITGITRLSVVIRVKRFM